MKKELSLQIILFVLQIMVISLAIFVLLTIEPISSTIAASTFLCSSLIGLFASPASFAKVFIKKYEISEDSEMYKKIRKTRFLTIFIFIYWFQLIKNSDNQNETLATL